MRKSIFLGFFLSCFLLSCSESTDTCACWEELVTLEDRTGISSSCEYVLDMSIEELNAEAGPECVEKIDKLLFTEDDINTSDEITDDSMYEEVETFE